jgi:glutathione synthase/RimK-type ligase-like ATP-grasp enzyme
VTPARVFNRPLDMTPNHAKPYQGEQIRKAGFAVPDTLLTTDPDEVRAFARCHREVIYKGISSHPSVVTRLDEADLERLDALTVCPTQFQERITGDEYRVHVVENEVFAARIVSQADDYRYPGAGEGRASIVAAEVPVAIADRCREMARQLRLPLAGVDLRVTAADVWYCFEVNPAPAFHYYQRMTAQPIADAIARALLGSSATMPG